MVSATIALVVLGRGKAQFLPSKEIQKVGCRHAAIVTKMLILAQLAILHGVFGAF